MLKKNVIIFLLLLAAAGALAYPRFVGRGEAASVRDVTANPGDFLGPLTLTDVVGDVRPEDAVIVLVDYGCGACQIPVFVPFTAAQQAKWETENLYAGTLPSVGETVTVSGTLKRQDGYFVFEVDVITREGQVIINRVRN